MVRSMMSLTDLPLSFWGYALETAAFTLNRAPSKSVETTPYELWFGKKPKLSFLKVWGCDAYVKKLQPDKLEPKAEKCVFIGYPKETIGYTFYHRSEGKIFVAKNGSFLEKEFLTKEVTGRKVELDEVDEPSLIDQSSAVPEEVPVQPAPIGEEANDDDHETSNEEATEPRRSTRERTTPDWYDPCLNVMIVDDNDEDPATYEEAMMSPDSNKWQEAMKSEMGSMYDNKVWTLVDLPDSRKAVENKWIFKRKTDADGNITVYKARLVAKGFRQIQGVDYDETFSPVAKLKSVRILLAIAAFFDYEIWQMDVKTAFLNGDIEEELYMVQPKGFVDPKNADKPLIKDLLRIGTQFVGYRDYASKAEEKLVEANERANTLTQQLEQSEKARKKAESDAVGARAEADKAKADAAGVEDLRKRLHDAETSLSEHITAQSAREEAILKRIRTQSRFVGCCSYVSKNSMLQLLIDASLDMAGAFLDTVTEDERVEARSNVLLRLARDHGSTFWAHLNGLAKSEAGEVVSGRSAVGEKATATYSRASKNKDKVLSVRKSSRHNKASVNLSALEKAKRLTADKNLDSARELAQASIAAAALRKEKEDQLAAAREAEVQVVEPEEGPPMSADPETAGPSSRSKPKRACAKRPMLSIRNGRGKRAG
ncbi:hypothetical protein QYE76_052474 [Lolium multiflorum]|uniref:Retrotransposon protein, putative, Ty1-copia subclass n=1 Tax=Lolium multiflorum TaxID=4521 RepID=A0AAD8WLK9_LOLMU|nr:hypothetical protein QYE76_052474 [Lolium multiflorum]